MKKSLFKSLLAILAMAIVFISTSSCTKEHLIVGKWILTEQSEDGVNWQQSASYGYTIDFKYDGTVVAGGETTTYSVKGSMLTLDREQWEIYSITQSEMILKNELVYIKFIKE